MRKNKIQNAICRSRLLLPCCVLLSMALWCFPLGGDRKDSILGFVLCILITYVLMEMCNSNSLIRVYTRSVSSFFILSAACMGFMHTWQPATISAVCTVTSMYMIFKVSNKKDLVIDTFHIFVILGTGCVFLPQLVVFLPFHYWFIIVMAHSFSFRSFFAGIIGFAMPGCAALGICDITGNLSMAEDWYACLTTLHPLRPENYLDIDTTMAICWITLIILTLWCGFYLVINRRRDKIRIRTLYQLLYTQVFVLIAMAALQPHLAPSLFPATLVGVSPFVAHYFTLSETRLCTVVFFATLLVLCYVALLTLADNITITNIIGTIFN